MAGAMYIMLPLSRLWCRILHSHSIVLRIQVFWSITLGLTPEELTPQGHDMLHTVEQT